MTEAIKEIKGYQLHEMLGEGGFGTVYRAYQPMIRRDVAVKVIRSSYANQPEFIRRFEAEAQLVARLEHLHIVPLYDFWRDPTGAYLVMRLLRGGSLRDELQQREQIPVEDVVRMVTQISSALSVAHRKGVVHRDLKPANILLDEEKNAYLTDFGIAKDVEHGMDASADDEEGTVVGTPAYSPPEQLQSLTPTPQSDIYSFGLIVYELITGRDAMAGNSISEAIRNQLYEPLPEIDPDEYSIPPSVNDVLATATAKDPEERYADIMLFARDFKHAFASFSGEIKRAVDEDTGEFIVIPDDTMSFSIEISDLAPTTGGQLAVVNPYKGLRAFQESDATDFYGRKELTNKLIDRLNEDRADARFLAVIGPSGSGKSSVVKAGVIPALRDGALAGSQDFFIAEMVPSADALDELESVLLSIAVSPPDNLRERLAESETGLFDLLNEILPDDGSDLFLLIDQFEEIFTQTEDNRVRTHFMNSLQYAITHPESRLWSIITIRADFYDKPLLYPKFGELVRERGEIVLPLSRSELEAAIVQPAKNMGIQMEQELIEKIISDVQEEPGALPLLQYALTELFDRRSGLLMTLATYEESGGVLGSLARRAEELYLEMDERHQEAIRQMFLRLVTLGEGTEDTRRRVRWSELSFYDGNDDPMARVRDTFTQFRLLTTDNDPQTREPTLEVAHEALIRQWQRLRTWLADNRDNIRTQRQVVAAVNEWHQNNNDNSFLASGMRLNQFELLVDNTDIALTHDEKDYILASIDQREAIRREEEEREARERALEERARRNLRYLVGVMTVGLLIASVLAVFAFSQRQIAVREAIVNNSVSLSNLARFWERDGERPLLGLGYAIEANNIANPPLEVQQTLANLIWQPGARRQIIGHEYEVWSVAYSADGETIFTGDGGLSDLDGDLRQWDAQTGDLIRQFDDGHNNRIYTIDVSPDGRYVATGSQDTNVIIWDIQSGMEIHRLTAHDSVIFSVMFTNDSTRLLSGSSDGIIVWDVESGEIIDQFTEIHSNIILDMDITNDDQYVFSGSFDGTVVYWELASGDVIQRIDDAGAVVGARIFPDESKVAWANFESELVVWDLETQAVVREFVHDEGALRAGVEITPDGELIITGDDVGNVLIWDLTSDNTQPSVFFSGHNGNIPSVDIHPDGSEIVTGAFDKSAIIWDYLGRSAEVRRFEDNVSGVYSATQSSDSNLIASGAEDGRIFIWATDSGNLLHEIETTSGIVYAVSFSPDNDLLASAHEDGSVMLWNVTTGASIATFTDLQAPVRSLAFSPDGTRIAAGGGQVQVTGAREADNRIIIWDLSGNIQAELEGHLAAVRALVYTPDGNQLLSGSDDTSIILWNLGDNTVSQQYDEHTDSVWALDFNSDGSEFLSGSRDTRILQWNTASGNVIAQYLEHETGVRAVAFHPDNIHAVSGAGSLNDTGGYDLLYWNLADGVLQWEISGHTATIRSVTFTSDGENIISASDDSNLIIWHADTLETLQARISENYQIVCVPNATNTLCESVTSTVADSDDPVSTPSVRGFPDQNDTLVAYADDSLCYVPAGDETLPNTSINTTPFITDGPYTIGYSNGNVENTPSDWIASWATYEATQNEQVADFIIRDAGGNLSQQIRDIDLLVDAGVHAIIVNPIEQAASTMDDLQDKINDVINMGIPVIVVGNRPPNLAYTAYVGHDPFEVGCIMAQELTAFVDGEGSIAVLNAVDLSVADESFKDGERAVISDYSGINVAVEGPTDYSPDAASNLVSLGSFDGLLGYTGQITLGAQTGLQADGRAYVPFVSDHAITIANFAVENDVDGVFVVSSTQMGAQAVQTAIAILQGEDISQFMRVIPQLIRIDELENYDLANAPENAYLGDWENLPEEYYP